MDEEMTARLLRARRRILLEDPVWELGFGEEEEAEDEKGQASSAEKSR